MNDTGSDADSISDASNAHVDVAGDEALISVTVRGLCDRLRANDPSVLNPYSSVFFPSNYIPENSDAECIAAFQALKENTSVKDIEFNMFDRIYTKSSVLVAAEYVESSKTLKTLALSYGPGVNYNGVYNETGGGQHQYSHEGREMISVVLRALSRNTSVTKLSIDTDVVKFASMAFEELLTCTQTLQKLQFAFGHEVFDETQTAAIASGFANNTTLCDLEFNSWRETDLAPVLTALQRHPTLQKIHLGLHAVSLDSKSCCVTRIHKSRN